MENCSAAISVYLIMGVPCANKFVTTLREAVVST